MLLVSKEHAIKFLLKDSYGAVVRPLCCMGRSVVASQELSHSKDKSVGDEDIVMDVSIY